MSDDDGILQRWSRRKREALIPPPQGEGGSPGLGPGEPGGGNFARAAPIQTPPTPNPSPPRASRAGGGEPEAAEREGPPHDPSSLPPIESIEAGTDVSAFLRPGVPADLARAALRRAWVADPAIRDFVGLAENAWDFNAPGGVPGFEPLRAVDDALRLAVQLSGAASAEKTRGAAAGRPADAPDAGDQSAPPLPEPADPTSPELQSDAAAQDESTDEPAAASARRRHGGALAE
jgi:hypothetical protein